MSTYVEHLLLKQVEDSSGTLYLYIIFNHHEIEINLFIHENQS